MSKAIRNNIIEKTELIEKEFNLTAMPTHRRVTDLMKVGLIQREKVKLTPLGIDFIKQIKELRNEVVHNMSNLI